MHAPRFRFSTLCLAVFAVLPAVYAQTVIYVADYSAGELYAYGGSNFSSRTTIGTGLTAAAGVAVAANGDVYLASQQAGGYITKFTFNGSSYGPGTQIITGLNSPTALAFDRGGNLYVANFGSGSVGKYDASGNPINASLVTGMSGASGIAFDSSGNIYVTAYNTGVLAKFAPSGGSPLASLGGLGNVFGVAVSAADNVYVASANFNRISEYDAAFAFVTSVSGGAFLDHPTAVAIYGNTLFVDNQATASGQPSVSAFNLNLGSPATVVSGFGTSFGMTAIPEPSTYAAILGGAALGLAGARRLRRRPRISLP